MRNWAIACVIGLLWTTLAQGGTAADKVIRETWDAAHLNGGKAGFVQTTIREITVGGTPYLQTTILYRLQAKRFDEVLQIGMDVGDEATKEGKVVGVFLRQYLGKDKKLDLRGQVVGDQLKLSLAGGKLLQPAPWDDRVVSLYQQQTLFRDKKVKPGDKFTFLAFEPSINLVVTVNVHVKDIEHVPLNSNQGTQKLLRVEARPDPVEGVQLPMLVVWLDEQLEQVRAQTTLPLGQLTLIRTTKAEALQGGGAATLTDIGLNQLIKLNKKIINPFAAKKAVYKVKIRDVANPGKALAEDLRQTVVDLKGDTFQLQIAAGPSAVSDKAGDEFLQSSYFINCEDAQVRKLAKLAVGVEKNAWTKALRLEKWVKSNMKPRNHEAMATADHVAKTLEGDCSEYAMLLAALCRAEGIPAKTALGLIYADLPGQGPVFSFHMWTEVWHEGSWLPLDATLGRGFVGATHVKIADHSWHDTRTLTPVLPLYSLLGKISVEVVRVEY